MKSIVFCLFSLSCLAPTFFFTACTTKQESTTQPGDLTGLQDFPKEWVLVDDIAPSDSILRQYIIPIDSSNAVIGSITIAQNGGDWQMTNVGFYYPGTYLIKNCKKTNEGEMVYYDFDLVQDTTQLALKVNFRHNPGQSDDVPSVFTCTTCESNRDVLMAEKSLINKYTRKPLSELQYD